MKYTIFGSNGRIGSYLKKQIILSGHLVYVPERKEYYSAHKNLGHVIYCSWGTSHFKIKSFYTIQGLVCLLCNIFQKRILFNLIIYHLQDFIFQKKW